MILPDPPEISDALMKECRQTGDFCPVLFEWYKFVAVVCSTFSCIEVDSPALRKIDEREYSILVGLLNRCSRLTLANVALSHKGKFGETTSIVDRCIFESATLIVWLCRSEIEDRFERYVANGLKSDLELKSQITKNIEERGGDALVIESRMLQSIDRYLDSAGLTETKVYESKRLPDLAAMLAETGQDRLMYIVGQRLGSHHVHGTWPSLQLHYLEEDENGRISPRDHDCPTHVNQYVYIPVVVLDALSAFASYVLPGSEERDGILGLFTSIHDEIDSINEEVVNNDFTVDPNGRL